MKTLIATRGMMTRPWGDRNQNTEPDGVVAQLADGRVQDGRGEKVLSNDDHPCPS